MKKVFLQILLLTVTLSAFAQNDDKAREAKLKETMAMEDADGWVRKGGLGLDLGQLLNINPYAGGGSNRLGIGGAIGYNANYKKGLLTWKNALLTNVATQRIGAGTVALNSETKFPFEKALDILNFGSNLSYQTKAGSKWAYSADLGVLSQILPSHLDGTNKKVYLKKINEGGFNTTLVSKFFSPALITFAPGMKYVPNKHWSIFYSPIGAQITYVADKKIANLTSAPGAAYSLHGTKLKDGSTTEYNQSKFGLGSIAKIGYTNTFMKKLNFTSNLALLNDYLDKPQNIDIQWLNSLGVEIFKGFNLLVRGDVYYDDNKTNSISDKNAVGGVSGVGKRPNIIEQVLLTYNKNF
jgi:hypothetical protein